jgi:hypothetical protein
MDARRRRRRNPSGRAKAKRLAKSFWTTPTGILVQVTAGAGVVAGIYTIVKNWSPTTAGYELPVAASVVLTGV